MSVSFAISGFNGDEFNNSSNNLTGLKLANKFNLFRVMSKTKKRVSRLPPFLYQSDISFAVNKEPGRQETSFPLVAKLRPRHISKKNIYLQGYFSADIYERAYCLQYELL